MAEQDPLRDVDNDSVTKHAHALLEVLNDRAPYPYACVLDETRQRLYVSLGLSPQCRSLI